MKCNSAWGALIAGIAIGGAAVASAKDTGNGPSSLTETYEDWRVVCTQQNETRQCAFSQQQRQQNGRTVLAIELVPAKNGTLSGTLLLPFGLALDKGVALALDDAPPAAALPFKTCLPSGCIAPLTLSAATAKSYRTGTAIKLTMAASDTGKPVTLSISLKGFGPALDRTIALSK